MSFVANGRMPKKKFKKIPDRWEDYSNIGTQVTGTKFVAFKVPLSFHEDWNLEELKKSVPDLKHIIDLTNTNRYYSPGQCGKHGWNHKKIFVPGHVVPGKQFVEQFYAAVSEAEAEDGLIGVHCTHGLNRTGYMVCRYMIEKQGTEPAQAIMAFDTARGHKQERENYLEHLMKKAWEKEPEQSGSSQEQSHGHPSVQIKSQGYSKHDSQYVQSRSFYNSAWKQGYNRSNSHYDDNWRRPSYNQRPYHDNRGDYRDNRGGYRDNRGDYHDNRDDYRDYQQRGPPQYGQYNSYDGGYSKGYNYDSYYDRGYDRNDYYQRGSQSRRRKDYETRDSHHNRGSTSSNSDTSQSKSSE